MGFINIGGGGRLIDDVVVFLTSACIGISQINDLAITGASIRKATNTRTDGDGVP